MPSRKPNSQTPPGVNNSYFDFSDDWRTIERIFACGEAVKPGQFNPPADTEDLRDAKNLARALVLQALRDLSECHDRRQGLRVSETLAFGGEADEREVTDWLFQDNYIEEVPIDAIPEKEETDETRFVSVSPGQTLHMTREADGPYSFKSSCSLLGVSASGARAIIKRWIDHRQAGGTEPLVSGGAVAARERALEHKAAIRQRQIAVWESAKYPRDAIAAALHVCPARISQLRKGQRRTGARVKIAIPAPALGEMIECNLVSEVNS